MTVMLAGTIVVSGHANAAIRDGVLALVKNGEVWTRPATAGHPRLVFSESQRCGPAVGAAIDPGAAFIAAVWLDG